MAFLLFMLGTPASLLLNPLMWAATILYVGSRLDGLTAVSTFIDGLFPTPVFYAGAFVAVAGNAVLFGQKLITPLLIRSQRSSWDKTPHGHELGREAELTRQDRSAVAALAG